MYTYVYVCLCLCSMLCNVGWASADDFYRQTLQTAYACCGISVCKDIYTRIFFYTQYMLALNTFICVYYYFCNNVCTCVYVCVCMRVCMCCVVNISAAQPCPASSVGTITGTGTCAHIYVQCTQICIYKYTIIISSYCMYMYVCIYAYVITTLYTSACVYVYVLGTPCLPVLSKALQGAFSTAGACGIAFAVIMIVALGILCTIYAHTRAHTHTVLYMYVYCMPVHLCCRFAVVMIVALGVIRQHVSNVMMYIFTGVCVCVCSFYLLFDEWYSYSGYESTDCQEQGITTCTYTCLYRLLCILYTHPTSSTYLLCVCICGSVYMYVLCVCICVCTGAW